MKIEYAKRIGRLPKYIFAAIEANVTVSRDHKHIPTEGRNKEWCDFIFHLQNEYAKAAKSALNILIRYFKYRLGNPLLHALSNYEEHYFENPTWFDESGKELLLSAINRLTYASIYAIDIACQRSMLVPYHQVPKNIFAN